MFQILIESFTDLIFKLTLLEFSALEVDLFQALPKSLQLSESQKLISSFLYRKTRKSYTVFHI